MSDTHTPAATSPWMTFREISERYAGASRSWIYAGIATGDIPAPVSIGGKRLFARKAIIARDVEREAEAERETQARRAANALV
ncbi:helix-turn-helix domain-containing protein [Bradyrhizobium sp. 170]|uniref:helix-turn-helix transcriptional regulator n=1 Tax=Bradyrhizobium sp. 170 TaxID=2782641 RepID=UPI001FFFBCD5|nr:helix-turn-helix domain-containing protein [Bradyrhizobium sp. 170]UPK02838.1 helix-turn-helix domain-containing protein [Bradyrhizobium sp. 170]